MTVEVGKRGSSVAAAMAGRQRALACARGGRGPGFIGDEHVGGIASR
jgi:hypothetical protein